jgi:hypothetical protein
MRARTLLCLTAAALAAALIVPLAATPAVASGTWRPMFAQWRPGTPLPRLPEGWGPWRAQPSSAVLVKLKAGQQVPMTTPARAVANSAGIVNLEADPSSQRPCDVRVVKKLGKHETAVGATWVDQHDITSQFTFQQSSSSSLEIGESASGKAGSFTADGTNSQSVTNNDWIYPKTHKWNRFEWYSEFSYDKEEQSCSSGRSGIHRFFVESISWDGGTAVASPAHYPTATYCVPVLKGSGTGKSTGTAHTFSVGFSIPVVGFTGSAQTGWSQTAYIAYHWGKAGQACGTNSYPPHAAGIVAK